MNKLLIATSLLILSLFSLNGQSYEWVVDTIYTKADITSPMLYNGIDSSIMIHERSIEKIPPITTRDGFHIESQGKMYLDDLENLNTNRYIEKTFSSFNGYSPKIAANNNYISYHIVGDGTYLKDIVNSKTIKISEVQNLMNLNDNYMHLRDEDDKNYIYFLESKKKLLVQTLGGQSIDTDNSYFIIRKEFNEYIEVLDLNLNVIIGKAEKYIMKVNLGNFLFLIGDKVPIKIFFKDKEFKLDQVFTKVRVSSDKGIFILEGPNGDKVFNKNGQKLSNIVQNAYFTNYYNNHLTLYNEGVSQLYDLNFKLIHQGEYHRLEYIDKDIFLIEKNNERSIVNRNGKTIIPANILKNKNVLIHKEFKNKPLELYFNEYQSFYTQQGEKICDWVLCEAKDCYPSDLVRPRVSKKMVSELSEEKRKMLNQDDLWIEDVRYKSAKIVNGNGKEVVPSFNRIIKTKHPNHYMVATFGNKYGVIKVIP